jgi:hypothetical protein
LPWHFTAHDSRHADQYSEYGRFANRWLVQYD